MDLGSRTLGQPVLGGASGEAVDSSLRYLTAEALQAQGKEEKKKKLESDEEAEQFVAERSGPFVASSSSRP